MKLLLSNTQGTLRFLESVQDHDQIKINGVFVIFGEDIIVGSTLKETRDNLLEFLVSSSRDPSISQALYRADGDNGVIIQNKDWDL